MISKFTGARHKWSLLGVILLAILSGAFLTNAQAIARELPHPELANTAPVAVHGSGSALASSEGTQGSQVLPVESGQGSGDHKSQLSKLSESAVIDEIVQYAKQGRLKEYPFAAGHDALSKVIQAWGEPTSSTKAGDGYYASYGKQSVAFGYNQDQSIFGVRSYMKSYQQIKMSDVMKQLGKPDAVHTYQDKTHNQYIWIYQVNEVYELEFVFPKPTVTDKNPNLDHLNVFSPGAVEKQKS